MCGWHPADYPEDDNHLTIDHIVEKCLGGPSSIDNFQTLCDRCNQRKSTTIAQMIGGLIDAGMTKEQAREYTRFQFGYV